MGNWQIKENRLCNEYKFKDFLEAFNFVAKVTELAQKANHHPDIHFGWAYVKISLYSHDKNAITDRDHALADQISML